MGPFVGDKVDDSKGKLPLRRHTIHRREATCDGNPMDLLLLFQTRRALGLSGSGGGLRADHREAKRPMPGKFSVQVNAWLLEDFDPAAQPIAALDGKTLW